VSEKNGKRVWWRLRGVGGGVGGGGVGGWGGGGWVVVVGGGWNRSPKCIASMCGCVHVHTYATHVVVSRSLQSRLLDQEQSNTGRDYSYDVAHHSGRWLYPSYYTRTRMVDH